MGKNYYLKDRDILDQALEHSWGKSAEAKAKEKAYNREYYQRHKEEILRKARQAGEGIQRTAQNVSDYGQKLANDYRTSREMRKHVDKERTLDTAGKYGRKFLNNLADFQRRHGASNEDIAETRQLGRDYSRFRLGTSQALNEADKLARQNSPVERVKRDLRRTTAGARANVENAIGGVGRAIDNARDYIDTATGKKGRHRSAQADVRRYDNLNQMNDRLLGEAKDRHANALNDYNKSNARTKRLVDAANSNYDKYRSEKEYHDALASNPNTAGYAKASRDAADDYLNKAKDYSRLATKSGQRTNEAINATNRAYRNEKRMAQRRRASATALNEAQKARDNAYRGYDSRYDTKIARDLQNTYSKARGAMSKAEKAAQKAREDAKKRMKKWFNR